MSEHVTSISYDPTLQADIAAQRQHEALRTREDVIAMQLQETGVIEANLADITPLSIENGQALLASIQLGPDKRVQLWGLVRDNDQLDPRAIFLKDEQYDPAIPQDLDKRRTLSSVMIMAGEPSTNVGRENQSAAFALQLPDTVSRKHTGVELTRDGKMRIADLNSTNGTELLVNRIPKSQSQKTKAKNNYDYLFEERTVDVEGDSNLTANNETVKDTRLEKLFAPVLSSVEGRKLVVPPSRQYDYLFEKDPVKASHMQHDAMSADMKYREAMSKYRDISEEMKLKAFVRLNQAREDEVLNALIAKYEQANDVSSATDTVDLIRTNSELRYELGNYLLRDKLPTLISKMPYRVATNTQKNPNHTGYTHLGRITSQEYASLLAVSMIDGTFKEAGIGDEIQRDASGKAELGQHRAAAEELLGLARRR